MTASEFIHKKMQKYATESIKRDEIRTNSRRLEDFNDGAAYINDLFNNACNNTLEAYDLGNLDAINDMLQFLGLIPKDMTIIQLLNEANYVPETKDISLMGIYTE